MDYSSLILMERDDATGFVTKELGSYKVSEGAEHIKGFYVKGDDVYIKFDTNKDVEEWEYSAIYDVFDMDLFENEGFGIEEVEDEYNPTFLINFKYKDDHEYIEEKLALSIELIEEAVVAANQNAKLNGLDNCEFIAGDVAKVVKNLEAKPDLIVVDPPRPGVHKDAIRDISGFGANEIVYISCNPRTLVLDLKGFEAYGYKVEKVKLMDMFPNTPHCETVVKLKK